MATYAIGDIQGCYRTLRRLLERIEFDSARDRLWLVGDIVNRGPRSLQALRWAKSLGDRADIVLGNHDLHLLAAAYGVRRLKPRDTLDEILEAPDREELIEWLRRLPLLHRQGDSILVHAGLLPAWTWTQAASLAHEAEQALRAADPRPLLESLSRSPVALWDDGLRGVERLNCILQVLTRMRTVDAEGRLCLDFSGPPEEAPPGCLPWFDLPHRRPQGAVVYFGHWASLGFHVAAGGRVRALESGCVWGNDMTAWRLEDDRVFSQPCAEPEILAKGPN